MDGGGRREKEGRLEEGGESRTEEEGGARRGRPAASGGRTEEEGGARRGRPAASGEGGRRRRPVPSPARRRR